jgi:hypothetical protein
VCGKPLLDINIIHQRDKGGESVHPLLRIPEIPAAFLCGAEGGDKREGDLFPAAPGLPDKVAPEEIEAELDEIGTLLLRHDRVAGVGQRCNNLHDRNFAVG